MNADALVPLVAIPTIFFVFYLIFKTLSDNSLRKHLVDRGVANDTIVSLFDQIKSSKTPSFDSFKIGICLIAAGITTFLFNYYDIDDKIAAPLLLIIIGLLLVILPKINKGSN